MGITIVDDTTTNLGTILAIPQALITAITTDIGMEIISAETIDHSEQYLSKNVFGPANMNNIILAIDGERDQSIRGYGLNKK
jgi:ribosomal protein S28E/S33